MKLFKKLIETAEQIKVEETLTEEWHDVEGVSATVGNYIISAEGYFDETELIVNILNTESGEEFRAEVFKNGNQFDINVGERRGRGIRPLNDSEQEAFLTKLVQGFIQQNYDRILTPSENTSDDYDNYYNRRERMRQAREYRAELDADYD